MSVTYHIDPGGMIKGRLRVPGDKSISHRSIMLASIAEGVTRISGFLEGEDAIATLNAFRALGVRVEGPEGGLFMKPDWGSCTTRATQGFTFDYDTVRSLGFQYDTH